MFDKWPDVEITLTNTDTGADIMEQQVECRYCGSRENAMKIVKSGEGGVRTQLDRLQATAEYIKKLNSVWKEIESKKLNLWEAIYKLKLLGRQRQTDEARGFAGIGSLYDKVVSNCLKCSQPISVGVHARVKVENTVPETIFPDVWRTLEPPPKEVVARLIRGVGEGGGLGGTVESILERINPERFKRLEAFTEKVETDLRQLSDVPAEMKNEFQGFISDFKDWIKKNKETEWSSYINVLSELADYNITHGGIPV